VLWQTSLLWCDIAVYNLSRQQNIWAQSVSLFTVVHRAQSVLLRWGVWSLHVFVYIHTYVLYIYIRMYKNMQYYIVVRTRRVPSLYSSFPCLLVIRHFPHKSHIKILALLRKETCDIRHPMDVRHPVHSFWTTFAFTHTYVSVNGLRVYTCLYTLIFLCHTYIFLYMLVYGTCCVYTRTHLIQSLVYGSLCISDMRQKEQYTHTKRPTNTKTLPKKPYTHISAFNGRIWEDPWKRALHLCKRDLHLHTHTSHSTATCLIQWPTCKLYTYIYR